MDIYKLGSVGDEVKEIQQKLNELISARLRITGNFDMDTRNAVIRFQQIKGIDADGMVGPETYKLLFGKEIAEIIHIDHPPRGVFQWYKIYGNPLHDPNYRRYIKLCDLKKLEDKLSHIVIGWEKDKIGFKTSEGFGFYCHYLTIPHFQKVFTKIVDMNYQDLIKTFDGCWNIRKVRGGQSLSPHAFGIAIDLNAFENPLGSKNYKMDPLIIKVFEEEEFEWGGTWKRLDAMHFQYAKY